MDLSRDSGPLVDRWEVGSEFHWVGWDQGPYERWPEEKVVFALAQHGLTALWRHCTAAGRFQQLWIPDYYCPPVVASWERDGIPMRTYADDPRWARPDWRTLQPRPGDLILAVNYFGLRESSSWAEWAVDNRNIRVVEDHSHDPVSTWARDSNADYAIASLRKTLPIPDGAIVWSPRGLQLPPPPSHRDWSGSALKLAAMISKRDYLQGGSSSKERYRELQSHGEATMLASRDLEISPWAQDALEPGVPISWREQRANNVRTFLALTAHDQRFRPIHGPQTDEICPFNAVLIFDSAAMRDAARQVLTRSRVYATVHWPQNGQANERVQEIGERILTVPLDQRYDQTDVARVATIITSP